MGRIVDEVSGGHCEVDGGDIKVFSARMEIWRGDSTASGGKEKKRSNAMFIIYNRYLVGCIYP